MLLDVPYNIIVYIGDYVERRYFLMKGKKTA